jgi:hypothetical protein
MRIKNIKTFSIIILLVFIQFFTGTVKAGDLIELNNAQIILNSEDPLIKSAAAYLSEQIFIRTGVNLPIQNMGADNEAPRIFMGLAEEFEAPGSTVVPAKQESYAIWIDQESGPAVSVMLAGRDHRGLLYAAGRLVRELYLSDGYISLDPGLIITGIPADALRAHQVITNTQCEDGFMDWGNAEDLRKHVDELILVGANGFEPTEPQLLDDHLQQLGIDLFVKLKCQEIIDLDTLDDEAVTAFFDKYSGIDHITTYGGDASGAVRPDLFFPHMERVLPLIMKGIPGVKWWYSNQCLEDHAKDYDDYIFSYLQQNEPPWLYGMVYGPWTKRGIKDIRNDLPSQYQIRHFPEICHPRWSQYPVPEWDRIFAVVWPRNQSIYAMPTMMRDIYLATRENTVGAMPYNHTGTYNDLNKFVWTYAGWDPEASVDEILRAYARLFFAHDFIKSPYGSKSVETSREKLIEEAVTFVADALLLLEKNWVGPLSKNSSIEAALDHWLTIADCIGGAAENWRVDLLLNKARIDAQIKRKYNLEMDLERRAYEIMRNALPGEIAKVRKEVEKELARIETDFQSKKEFLKEMQHMGLTDRFGDREEIAENIYTSFNDRYWILDVLEECNSVADLAEILDYENPGHGGFYDNLGVAGEQPRLVGQYAWKTDPGFIHTPIEWVDNKKNPEERHSKLTHALARYDTPLEMHWCNLDKSAAYEIRVVYNGPFNIRIRCETDDGMVIHDFIEKPGENVVVFPVPEATTADGELKLRWTQDTTDIMRGVSVSEIWLMKRNMNDEYVNLF